MNNLQLSININPNIVLYKDRYYLVISNILGYQNNPAYALFVLINDKVMQNDNDMQIFLHSLQGSDLGEISNIIAEGIDEEFILGTDYFVSYSLWNYLMTYDNDTKFKLLSSKVNDYRYPDYLDTQYNRINTEVYGDIQDTNIRYFYLYNKIQDFEFTKEELDNFASTFCNIILEETTLTNITDTTNLIYKYVLEFYANKGKDNTSVILDLIFSNTSLLAYNSPANSCCTVNSSTAGNSGSNNTNTPNILSQQSSIDTTTCKEKYEQAMFLYLIQMLSDPDFYCDWFYVYSDLDSNISQPNLPMIDKLKKLFEQFKELGYTLSWDKITTKCGCKTNSSSLLDKINKVSADNYTILDNYYKVLEYAENKEICNNKNKIKVYGTAFANILPYMYFV